MIKWFLSRFSSPLLLSLNNLINSFSQNGIQKMALSIILIGGFFSVSLPIFNCLTFKLFILLFRVHFMGSCKIVFNFRLRWIKGKKYRRKMNDGSFSTKMLQFKCEKWRKKQKKSEINVKKCVNNQKCCECLFKLRFLAVHWLIQNSTFIAAAFRCSKARWAEVHGASAVTSGNIDKKKC